MRNGTIQMFDQPEMPPQGMVVFACTRGPIAESSKFQAELDEMKAWCLEQFGPVLNRLYARDSIGWTKSGPRFYFTDHTMALAFRIRWC
jgi:hypothetical protein